ncbi:hypothetical protein GCM10025867_50140 (plasmid) [Frondihabitans sucicola]|uniref:PepSY domain-containing protein n=1 Tax=Frondihabitans sucicola TaxID=1268041 RepID=A0ABN6Y9T7_9MICO|nr:hypothetical protein [Frondihabitans sucicola]BDZ52773.1 hypothetical protein GCM10025867_50140 [Frondihabitans sucicola]
MGALITMRVIGLHGALTLLPLAATIFACYRLALHGHDSRHADQAAEDWADEVAKVISPAIRIPIEEARAFGSALPVELIEDGDCHSGYVAHGTVNDRQHVLRIDADGSFTLTPFPVGDALA